MQRALHEMGIGRNRRGVHEGLHPRTFRRSDQVLGSVYVGCRLCSRLPLPHAGVGRSVEDGLATGQRNLKGCKIPEFAANRHTALFGYGRVGLYLTRQRPHLVACRKQLAQQMSAQESACAG